MRWLHQTPLNTGSTERKTENRDQRYSTKTVKTGTDKLSDNDERS